MWWESAPPFILIGLALAGMGHLQGWVHQGFYGKPKAVCIDSYDRKLAKRDARIMQEIRQRQEAQTGGKKGFFS
ncbi:g1650 [Coccomyxa elongata]|nr:probable NADH dehydrogenase [ubiquinone] 1 alpha subcomplex subunit [Coccomyxa sp. Obi]